MTPELHAKVAASRARQGLPPTIEDPATLERAAAVIRLWINRDTKPSTLGARTTQNPHH